MLQFPEGLDVNQFLTDYWQQHPLVFKQGLNVATNCLTVDELLALACEPEVESRLIHTAQENQDFDLEHGPFELETFNNLARQSHWTVLVQSVNLWHKQVAEILAYFEFIPSWRLDDIMISYAQDQGSVGPHIDAYDVFLVQIHGKRRWRVANTEETHETYVTDSGLSLVEDFVSELDVTLEPGDILYLPPDVAHHGISDGSGMTLSVGFRSPALSQMSMLLTESFIENDRHYRDPDFSMQNISHGEISDAAMRTASSLYRDALDDETIAIAFGKLQTQPKQDMCLLPLEEAPVKCLKSGQKLFADPAGRIAWWQNKNRVHLFVNGEHSLFLVSHLDFIQLVCSTQAIDLNMVSEYIEDDGCLNILGILDETGYLGLEPEADETSTI